MTTTYANKLYVNISLFSASSVAREDPVPE